MEEVEAGYSPGMELVAQVLKFAPHMGVQAVLLTASTLDCHLTVMGAVVVTYMALPAAVDLK